MQNSSLTFLPLYKSCQKCGAFILQTFQIGENTYYQCESCSKFTSWCSQTILHKMQISLSQLEKLLIVYLDRQRPLDASSILQYEFIQDKLGLNTIKHYFDIFDCVVMEYYISQLNSKVFDGEVEIDESHLFKEKHSFTPHRNYALGSV